MFAYHGSPNQFETFNTKDVFLAKDKKEAMRYGGYVYLVEYAGKPASRQRQSLLLTSLPSLTW